MPVSAKKKLDNNLLQLFIKDFQPFSIVEDSGFREFTKALNPSYELPSRKTISQTLIPALYERCLVNSKEAALKIKSACITTDSWTSPNTESFMAATAHFIDDNFQIKSLLLTCSHSPEAHTSKNLSSELRKITEEWQIDTKVLICISDNAANIKGAILSLGWEHFGCYAHTLNLVVQDALKHVDDITKKVKIIVAHFKRSSNAMTKLNLFQKNSGVTTPKKLLQDVPTRWNSRFYMFERFVELEDAIKTTTALLDTANLPVLSPDDWKIIKQLTKILRPFEQATKEISGDEYMTASLVIPLTLGLQNVCQKMKQSVELHKTTGKVLETLTTGLDTRFKNIEDNHTFGICTFLDPRFKNIGFQDSKAADKIKEEIINMVSELISKNDPDKRQPQVNLNSDDADDEFSIWSSHDVKAASHKPQGTASSRAVIEVQRYMEAELLGRKEDPLDWWRNHHYNYPYLKNIVQEKCCALATSVPCERLFSKAGTILSERRTRLKPHKVNQLLTLNVNREYY